MKLESVKYWFNDGYPQMDGVIDGREVVFSSAFKPVCLKNKMVYLGHGWRGDVDPIRVIIDGQPRLLYGYTQQQDIWQAWLKFKQHIFAGTFSELVEASQQ